MTWGIIKAILALLGTVAGIIFILFAVTAILATIFSSKAQYIYKDHNDTE